MRSQLEGVLLTGNPMKQCVLLFWAVSVAMLVGACSRDPETLVRGGYDEQEMEAAIARAQAEVDVFIAALRDGAGSDFAVKAPIQDGDEIEHFWLTDVAFRDGVFEGLIGNEPGVVKNVEFGQTWTVKKEEISDWMFVRDDKIHGNYTMRPLLRTMSPEEAELWRSRFATP